MKYIPLMPFDKQKGFVRLQDRNEERPRRWWHCILEACSTIGSIFVRKHNYMPRTVILNGMAQHGFPANVIRNQKYHALTFLPVVLYEQFRFFFNLYFLINALTQFIPPLQVGFLFTYISPLAFVLSITIAKEAWDDFKRYRRDQEANGQLFERLTHDGVVNIPSADIKVGHLIVVHPNQRVPADMILLRTTEKSGASFIRTDQLDGETDWKLRHAVPSCQRLVTDDALLSLNANIYAEGPKKDIYSFVGNFTKNFDDGLVEPLGIENTVWANTVVASGTIIGLVIYTGKETRSVMNTSTPHTKVGLLDSELNSLSKVLAGLLIGLAFLLTALKGFDGPWGVYLFRFSILLSAIIPISLRVNLDMGKTLYSYLMMHDKKIPGTVVRTSTIPEELGRIEYLLSDKTGTLTKNEMVFKKLSLGNMVFSRESLDEIKSVLVSAYQERSTAPVSKGKARVQTTTIVKDTIRAIALCHNVTPVTENDEDYVVVDADALADGTNGDGITPATPTKPRGKVISYQASSPDEIALVQFTEAAGLALVHRTLNSIMLTTPMGDVEEYEILNIFPFTSESKRMGIIVKDKNDTITFYIKGADVVMSKIVCINDWLEEECGNMAREGLRTLVFGKRELTAEEYADFTQRLNVAKTTIADRTANVRSVIQSIEHDLDLLAVTGVEDKLQDNVRATLETLRNAGIKVWMLTGDKMETATSIAVSSKLVAKADNCTSITINTSTEAQLALENFPVNGQSCMVIDGSSLHIILQHHAKQFISVACNLTAVVCCRCSPTQKAEIVRLLKEHTQKRVCAIGDGGNDVSMIQAADVGIGIVGKEGRQASLAADFSITQFSFISRLLLWHGRNSYKRSARLSQFVIHRGLIISFIQAIFSSIFYFAAIAIYNGWLLVGYTTVYTMAPVFSLVVDEDVTEKVAFSFPELYRDLQKGRELSYRTFFTWVFKSIYQAGVIMLLSLFLFHDSMINIVAITFTALILCELLNVVFETHTCSKYMIMSVLLTVFVYFASMALMRSYFDITFIATWEYVWRVLIVTITSSVPLYLFEYVHRKWNPPAYDKLA